MSKQAVGPGSSFYGNKGMSSSRTRMHVSKNEEKEEKNVSVMKSYSKLGDDDGGLTIG